MKPVIDVHAHIFNARDIPTQGYLRSRRYKQGMEKILSPVIIPVLARYLRGKLSPEGMGWVDKALGVLALDVISERMGKGYRNWAATLCQEVAAITQEMLATYANFDLYVPLMIDYEYWFQNSPDNLIKDQIECVYEDVVLAYKGKIHPFAPFDPSRELAFRRGMLNPDGKPEDHGSLALAKDAIENKGFIGIKLYNSMGYKPFNNESVDTKRRYIFRRNKMERYTALEGAEYDEVMSDLYAYCVEHEVPITAHCISDGIEAYPGASWDFCQPMFWAAVLGQERFKGLRLNLAHFGWSGEQGYHSRESWVKQVCLMLDKYDYLFTDVAHHMVTVEKENLKFKAEYKELFRDFPYLVPILKKRLLFGIDWHVVKRAENYATFKDRYVEVLKEVRFTDEEIDDFLGGNALRFLGLLPGGQNRRRLGKFYKAQGITPPEWFKATSGS
jgi:predicted TIM-barrel fold metal-dependent hydrolase